MSGMDVDVDHQIKDRMARAIRTIYMHEISMQYRAYISSTISTRLAVHQTVNRRNLRCCMHVDHQTNNLLAGFTSSCTRCAWWPTQAARDDTRCRCRAYGHVRAARPQKHITRPPRSRTRMHAHTRTHQRTKRVSFSSFSSR